MCCDVHGCMNPLHGRWGTAGTNKDEAILLAQWRNAYFAVPVKDRSTLTSPHPAMLCLRIQGVYD